MVVILSIQDFLEVFSTIMLSLETNGPDIRVRDIFPYLAS